MIKTYLEYDPKTLKSKIKFAPEHSADINKIVKVLKSGLFDIENPLVSTREDYASMLNSRDKGEIANVLCNCNELIWSLTDQKIIEKENVLVLLENAINNLLLKQGVIEDRKFYDESLILYPTLNVDKAGKICFSVFAKREVFNNVEAFKCDFKKLLEQETELSEQQVSFIELLTDGTDEINLMDFVARIISLLWDYYLQTQ